MEIFQAPEINTVDLLALPACRQRDEMRRAVTVLVPQKDIFVLWEADRRHSEAMGVAR